MLTSVIYGNGCKWSWVFFFHKGSSSNHIAIYILTTYRA